MICNSQKKSIAHRQHGAALITSLVILLTLTILGVTAMSGSSLQELMAGNFQDKNFAFDAAESALVAAEKQVDSWVVPPLPDNNGSNGVFTPNLFGDFEYTAFDNAVWANGTPYSLPVESPVENNPMYIIEEYGFAPANADYRYGVTREAGVTLYRITARGTGQSNSTIVMVQSIYGKLN